LEKDLRERVVGRHFMAPLNSDTEDGYLSGCWAVSQFLFDGPEVDRGFRTLFEGYDSLSYDTRRALLEAVYAVAARRYDTSVAAVMDGERDARLFTLCAAYLYRDDPTVERANALKIRMVELFPGYDTIPLLQEFAVYAGHSDQGDRRPDIRTLLHYRGMSGQKTIYSFQRQDRDYAGLAVVQNADGSWVRDGQGRLQVFEQLARSGPALPYFLTNGNTPQGIYSIQGTDVSRTNFIGPTPNLQLLLPFEKGWGQYFHLPEAAGAEAAGGVAAGSGSAGAGVSAADDTASAVSPGVAGAKGIGAASVASAGAGIDSLGLYLGLLPPEWREYAPMREAWAAGHIGRTEIIAHGTTIDPEYYRGRPFYPLTPTMGCLCAKELWNPTSGHLLVSEQNNLVNAFLSTPGRQGFLLVIDVDHQHRPVSRAEVEAWIK
jgi:hypothetical protein